MTTGVINEILQGIVTPENNYALSYLATLLGEKLVFNTGTNTSLLAYLSAALAPIYLSVLFAIMSYIGIGGTIHTAMDGEFLGRGWHSVGVPSFLMLCIMLLSPVPSQNGITFGQVLFVKTVVIGSNFGDVVLKTAVEQNKIESQAADAASQNESIAAVANQQMRVVSDRMQNYLKIYACSMQYTINGGAQDAGYFVQLASLCGVPGDIVALYIPHYKAKSLSIGDDGKTTQTAIGTDSIKEGTSDAAIEYKCMFETFESLRTTAPSAEAISASGGIIKNKFPIRVPTLDGTYKGNNLLSSSRAQVQLDMDAMLGVWPLAVMTARACIYKNITTPSDTTSNNTATQEPWSQGWALAAALAEDDLQPIHIDTAGAPNPDIKSPQPSNLPNTGSDSLAQMQISTLIRQIDDGREALDTQMSNLALSNENSSSPTAALAQYKEPAKIGAAAVAQGSMLAAKTMTGSARVSARAFSNGIFKVWGKVPGGDLLKRTTNLKIGGTLKLFKIGAKGVSRFFIGAAEANALLKEASDVQIMGFKGVGLIAKGLTTAAKFAGKAVKAFASAIFSIPGFAMLIGYGIIILNILTLAPELIMAIALILWLMQVTAWFLMVPIATLIIAIPNTRVGHSSWRSALALALTPGVIVLFYLVSLVMFDIIIEVSFTSMFRPYQMGDDFVEAAKNILLDLFTGEIVFRFFAFLALLGVGFFFTLNLVLRGPRWFFSKVGLDSSMDEFGGDFSQGMEGKMKMGGADSAMRHIF